MPELGAQIVKLVPSALLRKAQTVEIQQARTPPQPVNREAMSIYWWLGQHIAFHQDEHEWGKSMVLCLLNIL